MSLYMKRLLIIVAWAVMFTACAPYQARRQPIHYKAIGEASWYGPGFAGRRTASGERFNPKALTAAHKTLPFGTTVQVTNRDNGKSVVVRINDRGPYVRGRLIDLSRAAAERINITGPGTAHVEMLALVGPEDKKSPPLKKIKRKKKIPASPPTDESAGILPAPTTAGDSEQPQVPRRFNPSPDSTTPEEELYEEEEDAKEKAGVPGAMEEF